MMVWEYICALIPTIEWKQFPCDKDGNIPEEPYEHKHKHDYICDALTVEWNEFGRGIVLAVGNVRKCVRP